MPSWLRFGKPEPRLEGAPAVRRLKTYSAESGFVFQYVYEGSRELEGDREFVFSASHDRETYYPVRVIVGAAARGVWESANRPLSVHELYGIAKLALMSGFDGADPRNWERRVEPGEEEIGEYCRRLDY